LHGSREHLVQHAAHAMSCSPSTLDIDIDTAGRLSAFERTKAIHGNAKFEGSNKKATFDNLDAVCDSIDFEAALTRVLACPRESPDEVEYFDTDTELAELYGDQHGDNVPYVDGPLSWLVEELDAATEATHQSVCAVSELTVCDMLQRNAKRQLKAQRELEQMLISDYCALSGVKDEPAAHVSCGDVACFVDKNPHAMIDIDRA